MKFNKFINPTLPIIFLDLWKSVDQNKEKKKKGFLFFFSLKIENETKLFL